MNHATRDRRNVCIDPLEPRQLCSHAPAVVSAFKETDLVANTANKAKVTDANLANPWGIAFNTAHDVIWTANNGTGNSTVYNPDGTITDTGGLYDSITIPPPTGSSATSTPTGEIFNASSGFVVQKGNTTGAAAYIFSTEDGTISGWNPSVDPANAVTEVDRSGSHAIYKGLAEVTHKGKQYIYATDFHNRRVDVFNTTFARTIFSSTAFVDPNLPKHFAPFGIQNVGGNLFVTYTKQDASRTDDLAGAGNGVVDVFSYKGALLRRFATGGTLNSPWGVVQAPTSFGKLAGDVLVGNFGDGKISAFNANTGKLVGLVGNTSGKAFVLSGLWGMTFGPAADDSSTLFFTAGPNDEADGILGTLTNAKLKKVSTSTPPSY